MATLRARSVDGPLVGRGNPRYPLVSTSDAARTNATYAQNEIYDAQTGGGVRAPGVRPAAPRAISRGVPMTSANGQPAPVPAGDAAATMMDGVPLRAGIDMANVNSYKGSRYDPDFAINNMAVTGADPKPTAPAAPAIPPLLARPAAQAPAAKPFAIGADYRSPAVSQPPAISPPPAPGGQSPGWYAPDMGKPATPPAPSYDPLKSESLANDVRSKRDASWTPSLGNSFAGSFGPRTIPPAATPPVPAGIAASTGIQPSTGMQPAGQAQSAPVAARPSAVLPPDQAGVPMTPMAHDGWDGKKGYGEAGGGTPPFFTPGGVMDNIMHTSDAGRVRTPPSTPAPAAAPAPVNRAPLVAGFKGDDEGGIQARASGGPVNAGQPYVVGEKGPEVVVPQQSGTVIPNGGAPTSPPGFNPQQTVKPNLPPLSALWTKKPAAKPAHSTHFQHSFFRKGKAA